jgi:hypothetical protein
MYYSVMPESPVLFFQIDSPLSQEQVVARLQDATEARPIVRFGRRHRTFEGVVTENRFDLQSILQGRNSFNPRLTGDVRAVDGRTILDGTMTLESWVMPFLFFWVGFVGFLLTVILILQVFFIRFTMWTLIPLVMFTAGIVTLLKLPTFVSEARTTARELSKVVDGSRVEVYGPLAEGRWRFIHRIGELEIVPRGGRPR